MNSHFYAAFSPGASAAIIGAGGKTTLLFALARAAKNDGLRVLVTTTTRIFLPTAKEYDAIDLSGRAFLDAPPQEPGLYVAGERAELGKMAGVAAELLVTARKHFDLILLEADGSKCKPLKGWREDEPVIPDWVETTIGVVDLSTLGEEVGQNIVHRLPLFLACSGAVEGEPLRLSHLLRMLSAQGGMWRKARGRRVLFCSKIEDEKMLFQARELQERVVGYPVLVGSALHGVLYD